MDSYHVLSVDVGTIINELPKKLYLAFGCCKDEGCATVLREEREKKGGKKKKGKKRKGKREKKSLKRKRKRKVEDKCNPFVHKKKTGKLADFKIGLDRPACLLVLTSSRSSTCALLFSRKFCKPARLSSVM